jgi:GNAT superfamily N-acetyltransferase
VRIHLRTAALDDLGIIHAIRRDAILGVPHETDRSDRQTWADMRSPEYFADRVAAGHVVIANSDGDDMGWGSSSDQWITGLYIHPLWSHSGVGRTLMSRLETEIVKRGRACARLASSPNAVGFYAKLGNVVVGVPDSDGAVPMQKRLSTG